MLGRKKTSKRPVRQRLRRSDPVGHKAFSYYERRAEDNLNTGRQIQRDDQPTLKRKSDNFRGQRISQLLFLLVLVVVTIRILSLSPSVLIVRLPGGQNQQLLRPNSIYQASANSSLAGSFLNRNKITVNASKLTTDLQRQFPELASVSVTLPLMAHTPVVYVEAVQPALILSSRAGSYVIDIRGKALLLRDNLPAGMVFDVPTVKDQSNLEPKPNQQALPASEVSAIQTIAAQLTYHDVKISDMTLPPSASEIDVSLEGQPYFVKFNLQTDNVRQQAGTFLAVQNQFKAKNIIPAHYIDVRLAGRAYYQ